MCFLFGQAGSQLGHPLSMTALHISSHVVNHCYEDSQDMDTTALHL